MLQHAFDPCGAAPFKKNKVAGASESEKQSGSSGGIADVVNLRNAGECCCRGDPVGLVANGDQNVDPGAGSGLAHRAVAGLGPCTEFPHSP